MHIAYICGVLIVVCILLFEIVELRGLNLCLAHFFFCSENPEKLEEMLEKYPNLCVDITPGGEMYIGFDKRREYFKDFFTK